MSTFQERMKSYSSNEKSMTIPDLNGRREFYQDDLFSNPNNELIVVDTFEELINLVIEYKIEYFSIMDSKITAIKYMSSKKITKPIKLNDKNIISYIKKLKTTSEGYERIHYSSAISIDVLNRPVTDKDIIIINNDTIYEYELSVFNDMRTKLISGSNFILCGDISEYSISDVINNVFIGDDIDIINNSYIHTKQSIHYKVNEKSEKNIYQILLKQPPKLCVINDPHDIKAVADLICKKNGLLIIFPFYSEHLVISKFSEALQLNYNMLLNLAGSINGIYTIKRDHLKTNCKKVLFSLT